MLRIPYEGDKLLPIGSFTGNRYLIEDLLGIGGMAIVYRVIDGNNPNKRIALKVLRDEYINGRCSEMFVKESKLMRLIVHPNVVRVIETEVNSATPFYTMEYIAGPSLEEVIHRRELNSDNICELIIDICNGLQVIHETTIVHCDLTPRNILFTPDRVAKITDFGLAHPEYAEFRRANQISGSLPYLAPEIWCGDTPSVSTDLYSLGTVIYEVLTGQLPFYESTVTDLMKVHMKGKPIPIVQINPTVAPWLSELVDSLMEKSPGNRPQSANEILSHVLKNL